MNKSTPFQVESWDPTVLQVVTRIPIQSYSIKQRKELNSSSYNTIEVVSECNASEPLDTGILTQAPYLSYTSDTTPLLEKTFYETPSCDNRDSEQTYYEAPCLQSISPQVKEPAETKARGTKGREVKTAKEKEKEIRSDIKQLSKFLPGSKSTKKRSSRKKELTSFTPPSTVLVSGKELAVVERLGIGGYSQCYLAKSKSGGEFAIKFVARDSENANSTKSRHAVSRIQREMKLHCRLSHTNIVKFWQLIESHQYVGLVLDYCPNGTLQDYIVKRGRMHEPAACAAMGYIFKGVQYLHGMRIHHADLKLSNIILNARMQPVLADFGFAKQLTSTTQMRTHLCGTPSYMAPEILRQPCLFGLPSDIWALGIVSYALVHGKSPFDAKAVKDVYARVLAYDIHFEDLDAELTPTFVTCMKAMLNPDPERRPTAKQLAHVHRVNGRGLFCGDVSELNPPTRASLNVPLSPRSANSSASPTMSGAASRKNAGFQVSSNHESSGSHLHVVDVRRYMQNDIHKVDLPEKKSQTKEGHLSRRRLRGWWGYISQYRRLQSLLQRRTIP